MRERRGWGKIQGIQLALNLPAIAPGRLGDEDANSSPPMRARNVGLAKDRQVCSGIHQTRLPSW